MADVGREIARIANRQHGVMSIARLRALGLSDRQIRRRIGDGRLHPLHRGVFAVGHSVVSRGGRWLAAVIACGPAALLSHRDGAALLDLRAPHDGSIEVTAGTSRRPRDGVHVHRSRTIHPEDRTMVDGIPVTALPRTLLDLAEVVTATELQRAYERAARLQLLDMRAIERLLARSNGRRGLGRLRALLEYDVTEAARTKSELEAAFLDLVRAAFLPSPLVNHVVEGYEVDAVWPQARLAVELQSWAFHGNRRRFEADHAKLMTLKLAGYEVLALTYLQVTHESERVVAALRRSLARTL